jgi:hypothetical protein
MVKLKIPETIAIKNTKPVKDKTPLAEQIEKYGKKGRGKNELIKYVTTHKPLSRTAAISAHCYDCMGWCADGQIDCECKDCSLYPYAPYTSVKRDAPERKPRIMTAEHKAKLIAGRKKK